MNGRSERGSILIVALWVMIFFGALVAVFSVRINSQISAIRRVTDAAQARAIAQSGISYVLALIGEEKKEGETGPAFVSSFWMNNPEVFRNVALYEGSPETFSIVHPGNGEPAYGLTDEESKININKISEAIFQRLYASAAELTGDDATALAQATVQYRTKSPAQVFVSLDELRRVPGMSAAVFDKIRGHLTLYGSGGLNVNTVPERTFVALGINPELAARIAEYRDAWRQKTGGPSGEPFKDWGELTLRLGISPEEGAQLQNIGGFWVGVSRTFRFISRGAAEGRTGAGFECVANRNGEIFFLANA